MLYYSICIWVTASLSRGVLPRNAERDITAVATTNAFSLFLNTCIQKKRKAGKRNEHNRTRSAHIWQKKKIYRKVIIFSIKRHFSHIQKKRNETFILYFLSLVSFYFLWPGRGSYMLPKNKKRFEIKEKKIDNNIKKNRRKRAAQATATNIHNILADYDEGKMESKMCQQEIERKTDNSFCARTQYALLPIAFQIDVRKSVFLLQMSCYVDLFAKL